MVFETDDDLLLADGYHRCHSRVEGRAGDRGGRSESGSRHDALMYAAAVEQSNEVCRQVRSRSTSSVAALRTQGTSQTIVQPEDEHAVETARVVEPHRLRLLRRFVEA